MLGRLVSLALAALAAAVLISAQPAQADHPANDVPLDMEHGLPLVYPVGLSVFNLYWDSDWDANNPGFARADIDAATKALVNSDYFDKTRQYGVPDIQWGGSAQASDFFCGGGAGPVTSSLLLVLFLLCEEAWGPFVGVPHSNGERIYNVILPRSTTINDLFSSSCVGYNAYHFIFPSLPGAPFGIPLPGRPIIFTVIPTAAACGVSGVADLMSPIAHEVVEAATDPAPLAFWIDWSAVNTTSPLTILGTVLNPLQSGEASDICQGGGNVRVTYGGIAMEVGAYWSNSDNACVVGTSRVVSMTFAETGVPEALWTLDVGGTAREPGTTPEMEGTSFAFPAMITDPSNAGVRYVQTGCTGGPASGTVTYPAGNVTANASASISCAYAREVFVRIDTAPAAAMIGNTTLTASQWATAGTLIRVTGDEFVAAGTGTRYAFRGWNDGNVFLTSRSTSFFVSSPVTVTAYYWRQHLVAFDQLGIPAATTWHVNVAGSNEVGPTSRWVDEGAEGEFSYESPVAGTTGTRYVLSATSTSSPLTVASPVTVTGTYQLQHRIDFVQTGIPAATVWHVTIDGIQQPGPSFKWVDHGGAISYSYETLVTDSATRYVLSSLGPPSPLTVLAPGTVTGTYGTQYRIDFVQTGIPANGTVWHVTIDGIQQPGPSFKWVDHGGAISYSYETPVTDAGGSATRYVLSSLAPPAPLAVLAPGTVTGTYGTQYLLTVNTSGLGTNTALVRNGVSVLGTATDAAPLAVFLPSLTVLSLNVDDPVNGVGGLQYFFNGFTPAPPVALTAPFSTTAHYATMVAQIDAALLSGAVKNAGLANSYRQQWAAVTADLAAAAYAAALGDIKSFINHLDAQAGNGVTAEVARTLRLDAAAVYHYALCQAVAAGQITPAERAASYAWYSALVTSLGGTPKPNC